MADAESKADFEAAAADVPPTEQPYDEWLAQQDLTDVLREGQTDILDFRDLLVRTLKPVVELADEILNPPEKKLADLCAAFELEERAKLKADVVHYDNSQTRQEVHDAAEAAGASLDQARSEAEADAAADQPLLKPRSTVDRAAQAVQDAGAAIVDAALGVASAAAQAVAAATEALPVPKDAVHVSEGAIIVNRWHIEAPALPYKSPYHEPVADPSVVDNIKKARDMIPAVPHGEKGVQKKQYAGTMQWTKWPADNMEGWMYAEGRGPFMDWFWKQVGDRYAAAKAEADAREADPKNAGWSQRDKNRNRIPERTVAGARCCQLQEGLTSAINTYDRCMFTWSTGGFGAPGIDMARVLQYLWEDENARKVMYLCGLWVGGTPNDPVYQYVDVDQKIPCLYYGSNIFSEDTTDKNGNKFKAGERNTMAWKVLAKVRDSLPMLWMFIALARDELTRDLVFDISWTIECGMAGVSGGEELCTEAAYVFCAEVQHEWNIHARKVATTFTRRKAERPSSMVRWAIDRFTADEHQRFADPEHAVTETLPSVDRDKAIVKGVFRMAMQSCQEDAFPKAIDQVFKKLKDAKLLKDGKVPAEGALLPDGQGVVLSEVSPLYALWEGIHNYLKPMQTGVGPSGAQHQLCGTPLPLGEEFPKRLLTEDERAAAGPDDVLVKEPRTDPQFKEYAGWWKIGMRPQCDFLFTPDAALLGYDEKGCAVVRDKKRGLEWKLKRDNQKWVAVGR
jgi:hypothetical protein